MENKHFNGNFVQFMPAELNLKVQVAIPMCEKYGL
jgi:hypothetical protein